MLIPVCSRIGLFLAASLMTNIALTAIANENKIVSKVSDNSEISLVSHRAIYEFSLGHADDSTGIIGATGRMVFEVLGSACEGYVTRFRFVNAIQFSEIGEQITDLRSSTFEDAEGREFHFTSSMYSGDQLDTETKGVALRKSDNIEISLEKPRKKSHILDKNVLFPTQLFIQLISLGKNRKQILEAQIYDGADNGNTVYNVSAHLANPINPEKTTGLVNSGLLKDVVGWPISVAYFDVNSAQGETLPIYRQSSILFENGISINPVFDYGHFSLVGKLATLTPLETDPCDN